MRAQAAQEGKSRLGLSGAPEPDQNGVTVRPLRSIAGRPAALLSAIIGDAASRQSLEPTGMTRRYKPPPSPSYRASGQVAGVGEFHRGSSNMSGAFRIVPAGIPAKVPTKFLAHGQGETVAETGGR